MPPKASPQSAKAAAATPVQSTPLLRVVRKIRNFSLTKWVGYHPYTTYFAIVGCFIYWGNRQQFRALEGYYPDYEELNRNGSAKMLGTAKLQEFADVQRYNNMVATMRSDLKK